LTSSPTGTATETLRMPLLLLTSRCTPGRHPLNVPTADTGPSWTSSGNTNWMMTLEAGRLDPFTKDQLGDLLDDPFALRPSPFALRPSPFALRPSPFALRSSLFALRPSPFALRVGSAVREIMAPPAQQGSGSRPRVLVLRGIDECVPRPRRPIRPSGPRRSRYGRPAAGSTGSISHTDRRRSVLS
jgi:hypothetical protein